MISWWIPTGSLGAHRLKLTSETGRANFHEYEIVTLFKWTLQANCAPSVA
jgi:hypothetical protein